MGANVDSFTRVHAVRTEEYNFIWEWFVRTQTTATPHMGVVREDTNNGDTNHSTPCLFQFIEFFCYDFIFDPDSQVVDTVRETFGLRIFQ
jgi:hypothetical protein